MTAKIVSPYRMQVCVARDYDSMNLTDLLNFVNEFTKLVSRNMPEDHQTEVFVSVANGQITFSTEDIQ